MLPVASETVALNSSGGLYLPKDPSRGFFTHLAIAVGRLVHGKRLEQRLGIWGDGEGGHGRRSAAVKPNFPNSLAKLPPKLVQSSILNGKAE